METANIADVGKLLHEAMANERAIDKFLNGLVASISDVEDDMIALMGSTAGALEEAKAEAEQLQKSTANTAALADQVSHKIRELDGAQSRVHATLDRINILVERSQAVNGVRTALDQSDYDAAVKYVSRYLEIVDQTGGDSTNTSSAGQAKDMQEASSQLEAKLRLLAEDAVKQQDEEAVARYACLFGPLRLKDGCDILVNYLVTQVNKAAAVEYDQLVEAGLGSKVNHLGALTSLFAGVANAIEKHVDAIKEAFGPAVALATLQTLHTSACDAHGSRIVSRYKDYRALPRISRQITMRRRDDSSSESAPVEPRQVEVYLNELIGLHGAGEEYTQYLLARMADAVSPALLSPSEETGLRGGGLSAALRELLSYYISLEEYFVEESVAKAIRIDETPIGSLTSSLVDDTFFVLMGAGRRAMATARVPSAVSILNQINTVLSTMYRGAMTANLQDAVVRLASGGSVDHYGTSQDAIAAAAAVAFNNVDVSAGYLQKLRQQLDSFAAAVFTVENDKARISLVLADLGKTSSDFKNLIAKALEQLGNNIMPRLQPVMEELVGCNYQMADAEYPTSGGWPQDLLVAFDAHLRWMQPLLTASNFDTLAHSLIDKIVSRLEAAIAQKQFTQIGGLQLERDIRILVNGFSEFTSRTVRDKFARISQIATVLGLETVEEAGELVADGSTAWRLSDADLRATLAQRVEFNMSGQF